MTLNKANSKEFWERIPGTPVLYLEVQVGVYKGLGVLLRPGVACDWSTSVLPGMISTPSSLLGTCCFSNVFVNVIFRALVDLLTSVLLCPDHCIFHVLPGMLLARQFLCPPFISYQACFRLNRFRMISEVRDYYLPSYSMYTNHLWSQLLPCCESFQDPSPVLPDYPKILSRSRNLTLTISSLHLLSLPTGKPILPQMPT